MSHPPRHQPSPVSHDGLVAAFDPITLPEMDAVALLNRVDTKFVFRRNQLPRLLHNLASGYRVLQIDAHRLMQYETLYFDTPDRRLFLAHHNDRRPRFKIRFRRYAQSDVTFIETKKKTRRGRTVKTRLRAPAIATELSPEQRQFVGGRLGPGVVVDQLEPSLWVRFDRLTLVHMHTPERLTLDIGLAFGDHGEECFPEVVIAELKQSRQSRTTGAYSAFRDVGVRPRSMSKYCLGTIATQPGLKYNAFKPALITLEKLGR